MCTGLNCNIAQILCEERTQGAPAPSPQSALPPGFRGWPLRKLFPLQTIPSGLLQPLARWRTRGAALQLGGYFTSPFSYHLRLSACSLQRSPTVRAWLGTLVLLHTLVWGNLSLILSMARLVLVLLVTLRSCYSSPLHVRFPQLL